MQKNQIKNNVSVYFLKNNAYKTNRISFNFYSKLDSKSASYGALVSKMIIRGNRKFPTTLELERELNKLYGASIASGYAKYGDSICYSLSLDILKDKYSESGIEDKGLALLTDCALVQTDFNEEYFFQEKENQINAIHAKENDKKALARTNLVKLIAPDDAYSIDEDGEIDIIANIELEDMIDYYNYTFLSLPCDIICSGEFDEAATLVKLQKIFANYDAKGDIPISAKHEKSEFQERHDNEDLSQSKLAMAFSVMDAPEEHKMVFNAIFGSTPYSKLFVNVREKMSLCYYVGSGIDPFKNIMIVESGINYEDFDKAVDGINQQVEDMKAGDFSDKDIDDAKRAILQSIKQAKASLQAREILLIKSRLLGKETDEEMIANVTKEDIRKIANSVELEAIYVLEKSQ